MKPLSVENARFNGNGTISATVIWSKDEEPLPYTASPNDVEEHGRLLHADLVSGKYGTIAPYTKALAAIDAEKLQKDMIDMLDTVADSARARNQSVGQLLDLEYQQVIAAHSRWYADGYDDKKCPDDINAWANAEGISAQQAAIDIAEAAAWREEIISQIRSIRLAGKAALRSAPIDADFVAVAQPYIDQLNTIH